MKAQMRFQKILTLVTLIIAALNIVYALGFFSGNISASLGYHIESLQSDGDAINATNFVDKAQSFVGSLVTISIIYIVISVLLYFTASNSRRNYYVTNYISVGLVIAFSLVVAIFILVNVSNCMDLFLNEIDWVKYAEYQPSHVGAPVMSKSTTIFALGYVVAVIDILTAAVWTLSLVWKILLMRGEKKLLSQKPAEEVV